MFRKRDLSVRGTKFLVRGEFFRKPRVSLLCFINVHGLLESFMTEATKFSGLLKGADKIW